MDSHVKGGRKSPWQDRVFDGFNLTFLILFVALIVYPIIYIVSSSISSYQAVIGGRVWLWPVDINLDAYRTIFEYRAIWTGYGNTLFYTFFGTIVNVILTIMAAYPLSRKDFYGRPIFTWIIMFTMFFSGGMIPRYLLISRLNMINTRWAMIIPTAISVWNVIITRTYFQSTLPDEMLEAAWLDHCDDIRYLIHIVLPLSKAIIAVNVLFYAVGHWNSYFDAILFIRKEELYPLQMVLRKILILNTFDGSMKAGMKAAATSSKLGLMELLKYALIVVASVPMLILYPFVQKYFVKGVMIGSLKG